MSTPSSRAFVLTTPSTSPLRRPVLDRAPLGGQVAAAVAADPRARPGVLAERLAQPGQEQLDGGPRAAEDDRLAAGPQERQGPAIGQGERRAAGPGRRSRSGGSTSSRWRSPDGAPLRSISSGVRPVRAVASSSGLPIVAEQHTITGCRAVVGAQPEEPAQDVGDVAAEDAPVGVELVDDDHLELLEQLEPLRVVGQDRRVEHVRVGHHDLAGGPDRGPDRRRRVAVVGRRGRRPSPESSGQGAELGDLVLAEGLGREQEEGPRRPVGGQRLEDRQRCSTATCPTRSASRRRRRGRRGRPRSPRPGGCRARRSRAARARRRIRGSSRLGQGRSPGGPGPGSARGGRPRRAIDGSASRSSRTALHGGRCIGPHGQPPYRTDVRNLPGV